VAFSTDAEECVSNERDNVEVNAHENADSEMHKLVQVRVEKAQRIRDAGFDPYANDFQPELTTVQFHDNYGRLDAAALDGNATSHTLAGRVIAMRQMGKASFLTIRDAVGEVQLYVKQDRVGERAYALLKLTDLGDIVGVAGTPMRTKTGELSVAADGFRVLTKALRPLPDKFHGLADVEQRYRERHVDLIVHPEVRRVFRNRSRIIRGLQRQLDARGFIEVETPILQDVAGGAAAKPFQTHHNSLGMDLTLRIATELHLKRLVVGGMERVYEIGRIFRNEGVSTRHNPEFTSMELYQAYATYEDIMELVEDIVVNLVDELHSERALPFADRVVNYARPWRRVPIAVLVAEHLNREVESFRNIDSVAVALGAAVGHTATPDEPLHIVLRSLSDEEARLVVPGFSGVDPKITNVVHRAKAAWQAAVASGEGAAFFASMGVTADALFSSTSAPTADVAQQTTRDTLRPGGDISTSEGAPVVDLARARRRDIALSLLYAVFDHEVERTITNPTFITDFPVSVSPLARKRDGDPAVTDRFELIVAGMELANAFSELNDPLDQRERFQAQMRERERGDDEASAFDEDFCRALDSGMPPTAGLGIGIDRLVMVLCNQTSIRDVVFFPQMKRL
jgi:lysyl-tRNA synthetase, class II